MRQPATAATTTATATVMVDQCHHVVIVVARRVQQEEEEEEPLSPSTGCTTESSQARSEDVDASMSYMSTDVSQSSVLHRTFLLLTTTTTTSHPSRERNSSGDLIRDASEEESACWCGAAAVAAAVQAANAELSQSLAVPVVQLWQRRSVQGPLHRCRPSLCGQHYELPRRTFSSNNNRGRRGTSMSPPPGHSSLGWLHGTDEFYSRPARPERPLTATELR